ncbi:hypothetical protein DN069_15295 [Streptacidiphilus pinicola]|uniref:Ribosomal protein L7/L12 C-terminal domain-containing protein n=1 Tax=Streptacidiphilus pinicola TaxID=2219663 RepID=A0A2X0KC06_9ACTN|nr:hypothetical protein [Streptacidiphilus pinicola]RAG84799.1 hypothetical protein DN069_15295 [Streptacidiphilus pinicola]
MEPVDTVTVEQRLAAIEEKLDLVLARLGALGALGALPLAVTDAPLDSPQDADPVLELVRLGKKIQAIKVYRERTGASLRQAKDEIDAMAQRERARTGRG